MYYYCRVSIMFKTWHEVSFPTWSLSKLCYLMLCKCPHSTCGLALCPRRPRLFWMMEDGGWEVLPGEELTIHWLWLWCYHCSAFPRGVLTAHLRRAPVPPGQRATIGSAPGRTTSAWKSSIRRFVITEKAPTRAFSWLKAATTAFTFKTLC